MNSFDKRIVYDLFCNSILLQYLNNKDRTEFSSTCKFVFQRCTRFRLSSYKVNSTNFEDIAKLDGSEVKLAKKLYNGQIEYVNTIVNKYKPHLISLAWIKNENYSVLEYFSIVFNYLSSLCLVNLRIPQKNFKKIIENLPNLCELFLSQIGISLGKSGKSLLKLKFPVHLKELEMWHCYQFSCDSKDFLSIETTNGSSFATNQHNLDISNYSINSIKHLVWHSDREGNTNTLNELLLNNQKLEKLQLLTYEPYFDSLLIISKNINLTKLTLFNVSDNALDRNYVPKLPFIKSLEIFISDFGLEFAKLLLQNCPNLEELKCYLACREENRNITHQIIKSSRNLKKLSIVDNYLNALLSIPFPASNIEHLEFCNYGDILGKFGTFVNLKHLKSIKITRGSKSLKSYDFKIQLFPNGECWREIVYSNSIEYWKIF